MPNSGYFNVPFIPQEGVNQQILQSLGMAFQHHLQTKQLDLEQQRVSSETQRNKILDQYTSTQIAHEAANNAYQQETDPIKKQALLTDLNTKNLEKAELEHRLKFYGIDLSGISGPGAHETPTTGTSTAPPSPFMDNLQKIKSNLGKLTPEEEAMWENGATVAQQTMNSAPVSSALKDIADARTRRSQAMLGTTPYKAWHDQFVQENSREPNTKEITAFTTAGQALKISGMENLKQDNYIDTSVPGGGAVVAKTAGEFAEDNKQEPGRYIKYNGTVQNSLKAQGLINDIRDGMTQMRKAVTDPAFKGLSAQGRALMALATKTPDNALQTVSAGMASEKLSDAEQNYIIAHATVLERAMSMRGIQGQGAGSDEQRRAISNMLPGFVTADPKMALKQLDTLENNVKNLDRTIPKIGKSELKTSAGGSTGEAPAANQPKATHRYNTATGQIEEIKTP